MTLLKLAMMGSPVADSGLRFGLDRATDRPEVPHGLRRGQNAHDPRAEIEHSTAARAASAGRSSRRGPAGRGLLVAGRGRRDGRRRGRRRDHPARRSPNAPPRSQAGGSALLDRLRLDGFHLGLVEVVGVGDQHAQDLFAQLHVALDRRDGRRRGGEVGDDVHAALLLLHLVGELPLVPLLDDEDLRRRASR